MERIHRYDNENWKGDIGHRSTLHLYKTYKTEIREESFYDNTHASSLMFQARSNTLRLAWRNRFQSGEIECKLCNNGQEEDLHHFVLGCEKLQNIRVEFNVCDRSLADILLFTRNLDPCMCKRFIGRIWQERKNILRAASEWGKHVGIKCMFVFISTNLYLVWGMNLSCWVGGSWWGMAMQCSHSPPLPPLLFLISIIFM